MTEACPKTAELSAHLDQQLAGAARARLDTHLAECPLCAAMFADLLALHVDLQHLPDEGLGFDLSEVIRGRLAAETGPRTVPTRRRSWRDLAPIGIGAAVAVSLGLTMGLTLTAGVGIAVAPRMAAMTVFDAVAPGGLCIGLDACYAPRRANGGIPR